MKTKIPKVLGQKDPNPEIFRNVQVKIRREQNKEYLNTYVQPVGEDMGLFPMFELRKPEDPEKILRELEGEGHVFANMGMSTRLTLAYNGKTYAILDRRDVKDSNETNSKLISGYIEAKDILNPINNAEEEIAEEVLIVSKVGKVLPGIRRGRNLIQPFQESLQYDRNIEFRLLERDSFNLPGVVDKNPVIHNGDPGAKCDLHFFAPKNCAQLVYSLHLDIPEGYLRKSRASLHHSEDKRYSPTQLQTELTEYGLLLVKMDSNKLTDEVYTFENGRLRPFKRKISLSEAFVPKNKGIATEGKISLEDYLKLQ